MIVATLGAIIYLWLPRPLLYRVAQASVLLNIVETMIVNGLAIAHPEAVYEAFITSRTTRGLPVYPEVVHLIERPISHIVTGALTLALGALWLFLFRVVQRNTAAASEPSAS